MTLEGETEAATFACWVDRAAWTAGGNGVVGGRARPSAQRTRIVKRPVREVGLPSGLAGVGVVERGGSSVPAESVAEEAFLVSLPRPLSMMWMKVKERCERDDFFQVQITWYIGMNEFESITVTLVSQPMGLRTHAV